MTNIPKPSWMQNADNTSPREEVDQVATGGFAAEGNGDVEPHVWYQIFILLRERNYVGILDLRARISKNQFIACCRQASNYLQYTDVPQNIRIEGVAFVRDLIK